VTATSTTAKMARKGLLMVDIQVSIQRIVDQILVYSAKLLRALAEMLKKFSNSIAWHARQLLLSVAQDTESRVVFDTDVGLMGAVQLSFLRNGENKG